MLSTLWRKHGDCLWLIVLENGGSAGVLWDGVQLSRW
jgi:hypothetical protein